MEVKVVLTSEEIKRGLKHYRRIARQDLLRAEETDNPEAFTRHAEARRAVYAHLTEIAEAMSPDEVDAGVGGATANHIAVMLGRLAQKHQVLVVTHLAQVAAHATSHFVVEKGDEGDRTVTRVRQVEQQDRPIALARMLSGKVTESSLAHARDLPVAASGSVSST